MEKPKEERTLRYCPLAIQGNQFHDYHPEPNGWSYTCARCLQRITFNNEGKWVIVRPGLWP